jgi:hypothetical protein
MVLVCSGAVRPAGSWCTGATSDRAGSTLRRTVAAADRSPVLYARRSDRGRSKAHAFPQSIRERRRCSSPRPRPPFHLICPSGSSIIVTMGIEMARRRHAIEARRSWHPDVRWDASKAGPPAAHTTDGPECSGYRP